MSNINYEELVKDLAECGDEFVELLDDCQFGDEIYLTVINERGNVSVYFRDEKNKMCGGITLPLETLKALSPIDLELKFNNIYYYNCNEEIED